jgi:hypothetical protein
MFWRTFCLFFAGLVAAAPSVAGPVPSPYTGALHLNLQQGIRFVRAGEGVDRRMDLEIDLVCSAGTFQTNAWAWFGGLPGLELPVAVTKSETKGSNLHLELALTVPHVPPLFGGGKVTYVVDGESWDGSFEGTYRGAMAEVPSAKYDPRDPRGPPKSVVWLIGRLSGGETASAISTVQNPRFNFKSVVADGALLPIPPANPVAATGDGPRLLFGPSDLDIIRAKTNAVHLTAAFAMLGDTATVSRASQRLVALVAQQVLTGATNDIGEAATVEMQTAANDASARHSYALADDVIALALAVDLNRSLWNGERGDAIRSYLKTSASRLTALSGGVEADGAGFGTNRVLGIPGGPADYRLAAMRAAAGMAALAAGDAADQVWRDIEAVAVRTVRRTLQRGIGERGAGNGNNGFADLVERVYPFVHAYRRVRGADLAAGTGAEWTAPMGAVTRGQCFNRGPGYAAGAWLAAAMPLARQEHRSGLAAYATMHASQVATPVQALLAVASLPAGTPAGATADQLPRFARDHRTGLAVLRSGWDKDREFVTIHEMGGDSAESAAARHNFSIYGLGREWVGRGRTEPGDFGWPAYERQNAVFMYPPEPYKAQIVPSYPAHFTETWFRPDGSGSVSGYASIGGSLRGSDIPTLYTIKGRIDFSSQEDKAWTDVTGCQSWRTVGADYSGASGAEALFLIVDGVTHLTVPRYWELDLGDVRESEVTLTADSFLVKPAGAKATMKGTFMYPGKPVLKVVAAAGGAGTRLRVWLNKPAPKGDGPSLEAMDTPESLKKKAVLDDLDLDDKSAKRDAAPAPKVMMGKDGEVTELFFRVREQISSISMGGGDRWRKARLTTIVVLTVQTGEPPAPAFVNDKESLTIKVGDQKVWYTEYLVRFAKRRGANGEWVEDPPPVMQAPPPPDPNAKKTQATKQVFEEKEEEGAVEGDPDKPDAKPGDKKSEAAKPDVKKAEKKPAEKSKAKAATVDDPPGL